MRKSVLAVALAISIAGCSSESENKSAGDPKSCAADELCVATPPEFWTGPVALGVKPIDDPLSCSGGYPTEAASAFDGLVGEPATCTGCSCGALTPSCGPADVTLKGASCVAGCENQYSVEPNTCQDVVSCAVPGAVGFEQLLAGAGSGTCTPIGPTEKEVAPAKWTDRVIACSGTSGTACGKGNVCTPAPPIGFSDTLCVFRAGEHSCPPPYSKQQIVHEDFSDDRSCACSCEPATNVSCVGMIKYWNNSPGCSGLADGAFATGSSSCTTVSSIQGLSLNYEVTPAGGQCEPSSDPAVGSATPESPITVCCLP